MNDSRSKSCSEWMGKRREEGRKGGREEGITARNREDSRSTSWSQIHVGKAGTEGGKDEGKKGERNEGRGLKASYWVAQQPHPIFVPISTLCTPSLTPSERTFCDL